MNGFDLSRIDVDGFAYVRDFVPHVMLRKLRVEMRDAAKQHRTVTCENNGEKINLYSDSFIPHLIATNRYFLEFLTLIISSGLKICLEKEFFKAKCILNSFSGLENRRSKKAFFEDVHRDMRFFSGSIPVMLNIVVMVDDFHPDRGPTLVLPESHAIASKPSIESFNRNAVPIQGKAGDVFIFNSNIWHRASENTSRFRRRALAVTLSRSFYKQLFDYSSLFTSNELDRMQPELRQFLGFDSRTPCSLRDWYVEAGKRFYKPNQD